MTHTKANHRMTLVYVSLFIAMLLSLQTPGWCGSLRINMNDGHSLEVPYYWEEGGQVKFEIGGGVVGVPKDQVGSVQEVLASREFDPEAMTAPPADKAPSEQQRLLREVVATKGETGSQYQKLSPEEGSRLLRLSSARRMAASHGEEQIVAPNYRIEGDYAELAKGAGNGVMLVLRNVLSSRSDLRNQSFTLTLYDGEGKILLRKPCEVKLLDVDQRTLRQMDIRGGLYSVMATVKPDPSIKRYEITSSNR